jgi:hypothetical protein
MSSESAIKITAKLFENRDTVRRLLRHEYDAIIGKWRTHARETAARLGVDILKLPMAVKDDLAPGAMIYLLAAVVDEVEGRP